jgi:hypothetical protein
MNIWIELALVVVAVAGVLVIVVSTNSAYAKRRAEIVANGGRRPGWSRKQTGLVVASAILLALTIGFILLAR